MTPPALERVPAPVRRVVAFTLVAGVVYLALLALGALIFPSSWGPGSSYSLSATFAAAVAALYFVYLGGFARLLDAVR